MQMPWAYDNFVFSLDQLYCIDITVHRGQYKVCTSHTGTLPQLVETTPAAEVKPRTGLC